MKKITRKISTLVLLVFVWPVGFMISIFNSIIKKHDRQNADTIQVQYPDFSQDRKLVVGSISGSVSTMIYDQEGTIYDDETLYG